MKNCIFWLVRLVSIFSCFVSLSQGIPDDSKRDLIWQIGQGSVLGPPYGNRLDFNQNSFSYGPSYIQCNLYNEVSGICDTLGHLLFTCNGTEVMDSTGHLLLNGDSINFGQAYITYHYDQGYPITQGVIVIPRPAYPNLYYILHTKVNGNGMVATGLYYSVVDMSLNNGLGGVTLKNQPLLTDTIQYGFLTACRHGNGRDWWVLVPELGEDSYYRFFIDPEGIHLDGKQITGNHPPDKRGQWGKAEYSRDGSLYARGYALKKGDPFLVDLYTFDRCTGLLSNFVDLSYTSPDQYDQVMSMEFSPDSHILYLMENYRVWQWDLTASNISISRQLIAVQDGFQWMNFNLTGFHIAQFTPDGRIFITAGGTPYIHVINQPDNLGVSCDLTQHSLMLFTELHGLPNFPNFRLGPLSGSPCDVLSGITTEGAQRISIKCIPNPASSVAIFQLDMMNGNTPMTLEIIDLLSEVHQRIQVAPFQSIINLNISSLPNGIYFAVLKNSHSILTKCKFLVQK